MAKNRHFKIEILCGGPNGHPLSPWIDFEKYYLQRLPAHIGFAVFTTITYHFIRVNEDNTSQLKENLSERKAKS